MPKRKFAANDSCYPLAPYPRPKAYPLVYLLLLERRYTSRASSHGLHPASREGKYSGDFDNWNVFSVYSSYIQAANWLIGSQVDDHWRTPAIIHHTRLVRAGYNVHAVLSGFRAVSMHDSLVCLAGWVARIAASAIFRSFAWVCISNPWHRRKYCLPFKLNCVVSIDFVGVY